MADLNPISWWKRFLALPNDSSTKTFLVAFLVASVSAAAVAITAVSLKPLQDANVAAARQQRMAQMLASVPGLAEILGDADVSALETRIVRLADGDFDDLVDPLTFDVATAAADPDRSRGLTAEEDVAGIGRVPNHAPVHLLYQDERLKLLVVAGWAAGYSSTIRAYVALEPDLNTIAAVSVYEQADTPGLGSRITDPAWLAGWAGTKVADEQGTIRIEVARGQASSEFEVDGITGATRSTSGVANIVRFWLGDQGFGPFLTNLREGRL